MDQEPRLDLAHQNYLRARALKPEVAKVRGYFSVRSRSALPAGYSHDKKSPIAKQVNGQDGQHALAIPMFRAGISEPLAHQLRLDVPRPVPNRPDKVVKFEQPPKSKRGNQPGDIPADCHPLRHDEAMNTDDPLIITEGVVKADALLSADIAEGIGVVPIALTGVTMGYSSSRRDDGSIDRQITECLTDIPLPGRIVYLAWDADWATNPDVSDSLYRFGALLTELEADVRYIYTPPVNGDPKTGVDDYLATGGTLAALLNEHLGDPPPPPKSETSHRQLFNADRESVSLWGWELRRIEDATKPTPVHETKLAAIPRIVSARTVQTVLPDNTIASIRDSFQIEIQWRDPKTGTVCTTAPVDVPVDQLEQVRSWLFGSWQTSTIYISPYPGDERTIAATIVSESGVYEADIQIDSTGWYRDNTGWGYLHSGGRIGASGDTTAERTETESPAQHLLLPQSSPNLAEAVRPWWDRWVAGGIAEGVYGTGEPQPGRQAFDLGVALRLGAIAAARAVLPGPALRSAMFVFGPPGGGKTLLARAWAAPFGEHFGEQPYTNFSSTAAGVEVAVAPARHLPVVVDDFRLGSRKEQEEMTGIVDRMVRQRHDGASRQRSTRDLGSMVVPTNEALLVFTGETVPVQSAATNSLASRLLLFHVPGATEASSDALDAVARLTRDPGDAPEAISSIIRWLATRLEAGDDGETTSVAVRGVRSSIEVWVPKLIEAAIAVAKGRCPDRPNDRTIEAAKDLALGAAALVQVAVECNLASAEDAIGLLAEPIGWVLADTAQTVVDTDPGHLILEAVRSAISAGHSCIVNPNGGPPTNEPTHWGWRIPEHKPEPARFRIGWLVEDHAGPYVALDPQALKAALNDYRSGAGTMAPNDIAKAIAAYSRPGFGPVLARQPPLGTRRFTVEIGGSTQTVVPVTIESLGRKPPSAQDITTHDNVIPIAQPRTANA